jgi:hypothetical protein
MSAWSRPSRAREPSSDVATEIVGRQPHLGADDRVGRFQLSQHPAEIFFRFAVAVLNGGVEIIHTRGERPRHHALLLGRIAAHHEAADGAATKTQHRELHFRAPEIPQLHRNSLRAVAIRP